MGAGSKTVLLAAITFGVLLSTTASAHFNRYASRGEWCGRQRQCEPYLMCIASYYPGGFPTGFGICQENRGWDGNHDGHGGGGRDGRGGRGGHGGHGGGGRGPR